LSDDIPLVLIPRLKSNSRNVFPGIPSNVLELSKNKDFVRCIVLVNNL